jgi:hypothetical protein
MKSSRPVAPNGKRDWTGLSAGRGWGPGGVNILLPIKEAVLLGEKKGRTDSSSSFTGEGLLRMGIYAQNDR